MKEQEFHALLGNFSFAQIMSIELALQIHLIAILLTQANKPRVPWVEIILKIDASFFVSLPITGMSVKYHNLLYFILINNSQTFYLVLCLILETTLWEWMAGDIFTSILQMRKFRWNI